MTQRQPRSRSRIFHVPHGIAYAIENSLWAVNIAWMIGFRWIDIDGQVSKDGVPMATHWNRVKENGYFLPGWFIQKYGPDPHVGQCLAADLIQLRTARVWFRGRWRVTRLRTIEQVLGVAAKHRGMGVMYEEKGAEAFKHAPAQVELAAIRRRVGLPANRFMVGRLTNIPGAFECFKAAHQAGHTTIALARNPIPISWEPYIDYVRGRWVRVQG